MISFVFSFSSFSLLVALLSFWIGFECISMTEVSQIVASQVSPSTETKTGVRASAILMSSKVACRVK